MKLTERVYNAAFSPGDREEALLRGFICVGTAGDRGVFVEGPRGISAFSNTEIAFSGKGFSLRVAGKGLFLRALSREKAMVSGEICALYFERNEP